MIFEEDNRITIYDIECYPNFLLFIFKDLSNNKITQFESSKGLERYISGRTLVGYNNRSFDDLILQKVLDLSYIEASRKDVMDTVMEMTNQLIVDRVPPFAVRQSQAIRMHGDETRWSNTIDLMKLTTGFVSLKIAGARLNSEKLKELPISPGTVLSEDEKQVIRDYCLIDIDATELVYNYLKEDILVRDELENKYDMSGELISRGAASLAEYVLVNEYCESMESLGSHVSKKTIKASIKKYEKMETVSYVAPSWVKFETKALNDIKDYFETTKFEISEKGYLVLKDSPSAYIDGLRIDLGVGGAHSCQTNCTVVPSEDQELIDVDFNSFYTTLMIQGGFISKHIDADVFLSLYNGLVESRLKYKAGGLKRESNAVKLLLNSLYGLLSAPHSLMYSPNVTLDVCASGQLTLLMLAEKCSAKGIILTSANTDGMTFLVDKSKLKDLDQVVHEMGVGLIPKELKNGMFDFGLEYTYYKKVLQLDVNSYIGYETSGGIKHKGRLLAKTELSHNANCNICIKAIDEWEVNGIAFEDTIKKSNDLFDFLVLKKATGGASYNGEPVGASLRWYYSSEKATESIDYVKYRDKFNKKTKSGSLVEKMVQNYELDEEWHSEHEYYSRDEPLCLRSLKNGGKVATSEYAKLCLDLPDKFPDDMDYNFYINKTIEIYKELSMKHYPETNITVGKYVSAGLSCAPRNHKGKTVFVKDWSNIPVKEICVQTGNSAKKQVKNEEKSTNLISVDGMLYWFEEIDWTSAFKTTEKKTGIKVVFGGVVEIPNDFDCTKPIEPLPSHIRDNIFNTLSKDQKIKINLANREMDECS